MTDHNKKLWQNYDDFALKRGELVAAMLSTRMNINSATILDVGCGTGGASIALAKMGANVTAIDPDKKRIDILQSHVQQNKLSIKPVCADINNAELPKEIDAIIMTDVIEHVTDLSFLSVLSERLKPNGLIYISTPNKNSIVNFVCDPHFSLPFVSILKRRHVKWLLADVLKWQPKSRADFPQLLTLKKIRTLCADLSCTIELITDQVFEYAIKNLQSVWNRPSHLKLAEWAVRLGLDKLASKMINNRFGLFNQIINPTFYLIARKNSD